MTTIAISSLPVATSLDGADVFPMVQTSVGVTRQISATLMFTNPIITSPSLVTPALGTPSSGVLTNCTGSPNLSSPVIANIKLSGLFATTSAANTIASATTIAPTKDITFISGTAAIVTITAPSPISAGGGVITLIPTGVFTWTTGDNIAVAGTAVVSKALTMTYDVSTTKWYPSYV